MKQNKMATTFFVRYPIRLLSYMLCCAAWGDDSELCCVDPHRRENGQSRDRPPASWARHPHGPLMPSRQVGRPLPGLPAPWAGEKEGKGGGLYVMATGF